jgi:hypothetical protein
MLGDILKNKVDTIKHGEIDRIAIEDAKLRQKQIEQLSWLEKIIEAIKSGAEDMAAGRKDVKINKKSQIFVVSTKTLFTSTTRYDNFIHSQKDEIGFFNFYKNSGYDKTLFECREWLDKQNIDNIVILYCHDGAGMESWNEYRIVLKD